MSPRRLLRSLGTSYRPEPAIRLVGLVMALAGAAVVAHTVVDVDAVRDWVAGSGWVAPVLFVGLYAILTLALVPGAVLTASAGILFGVAFGSLLVLIAATVGSFAAFLLARRLGREAVEGWTSGWIRQVDAWLADRGLVAVVTLRLLPLVPFSAANYAAGVTSIRPRDFLAGTAIGIVPGTLAYTALGAGLADRRAPLAVAALGGLALLTAGGTLVLRRFHGWSRASRSAQVSSSSCSEGGQVTDRSAGDPVTQV